MNEDPFLGKIQAKQENGERHSAYILCALTGVPKNVFPYHMEFINATRMLLQFRYGMHPHFAALDNEGNLDNIPPKDRPAYVYWRDQNAVISSDLIVADFSILSFGGGEEVERASAAGVPIIGVVAVKKKSKGVLSYYIEGTQGRLSEKNIHIGNGGASMMLHGAPAMKAICSYPAYDFKTMLRQKIEDLGWRLEFNAIRAKAMSILVSGMGRKIRGKFGMDNPRSLALKEIDLMLRERFGLKPETERLDNERRELRDKQLPQAVSDFRESQRKLKEIENKQKLLDDLLDFHPMKNHEDYEKYKLAFPQYAMRITPNDNGPAKHERLITKKFMPPKMRK
ncbi:MAG: hypothetical protein WC506_03645 [Candidatus Micrarchaeia archaeon]